MGRRIAAVRATAAALACAVLLQYGASAATSVSYIFGVLRRDGVVVPFARLDGTRWREAWVSPEPDPEVPVDLRSVPKGWWGPEGAAAVWYAAVTGRAGLAAIHVLQPDVIPAYCARQIALRTDYVSSKARPPIDEHPYPKDGIAVAPRFDGLSPIDVVDPASAEARGLGDLVDAEFNRIERNLFRHPIPTRAREATRPTLEAVYAYGEGAKYYYVEAVREYHDSRVEGHCAVALGHVWIATGDPHGPKALSSAVDVMGCDRAEAVYMNPLGGVRSAGKTFWVAQFAGWDGESYQVIELKPRLVETRLIRQGGSC